MLTKEEIVNAANKELPDMDAHKAELLKWQTIAADLQEKRAEAEVELAEKNATIESLTKTIENLLQSIAFGTLASKK